MKTSENILLTVKTRVARLIQLRHQFAAAMSASLSFLTAGMVRAWSAPAVPSILGLDIDVHNPNATDYSLSFDISKEQASWIASLAPLGALIGGLLSGFPLSRFGRKQTLTIASLLFFLSFLFLGTASVSESLLIIYGSRGVLGFGVGLAIPAAQIYIAECSEPGVRGLLASIPALAMSLGTLVTYVVGSYLPWHYLSYFCCAFPVLLFLTITCMPQSPSWLIMREKKEKAKESLAWLRGMDNVEKEYATIEENLRAQKAITTATSTMNVYLNRTVMMPLFINISLMFFQQWCGVNAIIFNTVAIFRASGSHAVNENLSTVIVGIVQFLATFISIFLIDKAGRKMLLIASGLVMSLSSASVGAFFYLQLHGAHASFTWLPLAGLVLFMVGYSLGFAAVPFVLMGELFPAQHRNQLGAIVSGWSLIHTFLVIKFFTNLETWVGFYGVFWIYAGVAMVSVLYVILFLPETKGKSLEQIEAHFRKEIAAAEI